MTKELSQIERATRFALRVRVTSKDGRFLLHGEDLLDAKALAAEFQRLLDDAWKRAEHARAIGRKGGRPKSKHPTKAALAKRKSRKKLSLDSG